MANSAESESAQHEWIIIGAGVRGVDQLNRLLEMGVAVTVHESGDGAGSTLYWNRYPGAGCDHRTDYC